MLKTVKECYKILKNVEKYIKNSKRLKRVKC